jgi:hypothetical protein
VNGDAAPPAPPAGELPATDVPPSPNSENGSCDEPAAAEPAAADEPAPAEPVTVPSASPAQETPPSTDAPPESTATPPAGETPAEPTAPVDAPAATDETTTEPQPAADAQPASPQDGTAQPSADPAAAPAPQQEQPPVDPKAEAQKAYDKALGEYNTAKATYESAVKSRADREKEGRKKVDELSTRFSAWYYVISADSFEKFKVARTDLVGPKEEPKPATGAIPGAGTTPAIPGLGQP